MKSRYRTLGGTLTLALVLVVSVTASASAALPEFSPGSGLTFTGTGGPSLFEVAGLSAAPNCESLALKSKLTGPKSGIVEVELKSCHAGLVSTCSTTGQASGVVDFSGTIEPVYLSKEPKNVGLLVKVSEFTAHCGTSTVTIRGSFLGSITPINKKVKSTQSFAFVANQSSGVNEFRSYETASGERKAASLEESFNQVTFVAAGFASTDALHPSLESEIKA